MLNKLRNKFVLINTLMVGVLLLLIVISITAISLHRSYTHTIDALDSAVNLTYESTDYSGFLLVHVDENGKLTLIENSLSGRKFDEKQASTYVSDILSLDKPYGLLLKHRILFNTKQTSNGGCYIAFAFAEKIIIDAEEIFSTASSVAAVALFLIFLLSRKLANIVIKPAENAWNDQKRFIADASHDLKTPLTVILANNEILMAHPEKTVGEQMKWIESTRDEGEYMSSLVNKMLELARTESLVEKIKLEDVNVSEVIQRAVLQLEPLAFDSGVTIASSIASDVVLKSNETELYRLTQILIDNAVKYAPNGSVVLVTLSSYKKEHTLSVNNRGEAIPKEQLEHIFDRFYRTDDSRSRGGFGLGLSIAKNVATALGGEISATSDDENGTTFSVKFKE